jgi:hypothetical protein
MVGKVLLSKTLFNISEVNQPSRDAFLIRKDIMVYVISINNEPLMPTNNSKARILLKNKKAKVKTTKPFTIQLLYVTTTYTQPITLGIDSGYQNIGFSAVTDKKELISGTVNLLENVSKRLVERAIYRDLRRKSLRYREPRFDNRKIDKGWLAPSIVHKLDSHIRFVEKLKKILPITKVILEVANFDIQKINNPDISGKEYQEGNLYGYQNTRSYVFFRDDYKCQNPNCKNTDKQPILQEHHIVFKENGGTDKPDNLITLCTQCHTPENHKKGKFLYLWQTTKPKLQQYKAETYMSIVRWRMINALVCPRTYGYITKSKRIELGLEKTHYNDAFIIANGNLQERIEPITYKQVRRNNRELETFVDAKYIDIRTGEKVPANELNNGRRTRNKNKNGENLRKYRGEKVSKGQRRIRTKRYPYQRNDLVRYKGKIYTVKANMGNLNIVELFGKKYPKVKFISLYKYGKGFNCLL